LLKCDNWASMSGNWSMGVATRRHETCAARSCSQSGWVAISAFTWRWWWSAAAETSALNIFIPNPASCIYSSREAWVIKEREGGYRIRKKVRKKVKRVRLSLRTTLCMVMVMMSLCVWEGELGWKHWHLGIPISRSWRLFITPTSFSVTWTTSLHRRRR